jgi:hypothetical protein
MAADLPPLPETLDQTFGDLWGTPIPQELAAFFRLAASSWAVPELLEWTAGKDPFQLERSQNANSFERLLDHPELLTGPSSWFSGLIGVGWREPDATYTVQVEVRPDLSPDAPRRVYFRGDTDYHWFPVALSLSHHLSYGATLTAIGRGELAQDAAREAIASYTDLADTLSTQEVVKELTGDVRPLWSTHLPEDGAKQWGLRSGWIVQLLLGEDLFLVEQAFLEGRELNLPLTDELHQRYLAEALTSPPAALYGLWRTWFFSDPRVSDYVEAARRSPSGVVRDASEVVQQLLDGRRIVSKVDLIATRDTFAALRLDLHQKPTTRRIPSTGAEALSPRSTRTSDNRKFRNQWFGDFGIDQDGAFTEATVELNGCTSRAHAFVPSDVLDSDQLQRAAIELLDALDVLDRQARSHLRSELGAADPTVREYLDSHLEELAFADSSAVMASRDSSDPRLHLLSSLRFTGVALRSKDGAIQITMDYMPDLLTDEILCVRLDATGQVVEVAHES